MTDNQAVGGGVRLDDFGYRTEWNTDDQPSTAVVVSVADATGTEQTDLPVLNNAIDGDALDTLLEQDDSAIDVTFEYAGTTVYLSSTGTLAIRVN